MKHFLFIALFSLLFFAGKAQDLEVEDRYDEWYGQKPAFQLAIRNQIHPKDYVLGIEAGIASANRNWLLFGSFDARPYRKRVLRYQGGNQYFQYTEERYYIGLGATYMYTIRQTNKGAFVEVNPSYTWGRYGGSERKPEDGWIIMPKAGFFWKFVNNGFVQLGYSYLDTKNDDFEKHRIYLTLGGITGKQ